MELNKIYNEDCLETMAKMPDNFVDLVVTSPPYDDLRNYNEVLKNCHKGEPVYLTKNGRGRFVVMDIEDYERDRAEKKLLMKLQEAEEAVKDGEGWLSLDELKALVGE